MDGALLPGSTMHAERIVLTDALMLSTGYEVDRAQHQLRGRQNWHTRQCLIARLSAGGSAAK